MTHVSKYTIPKKHTDEMSRQLFEILTSVGDKEATKEFLAELLTPTEQIMLSKRLATIAMLEKGQSCPTIRDHVNISSSTIYKLYAKNVDGKFTAINSYLSNKSNGGSISKFIQILILMAAPNARTRNRADLHKAAENINNQ